LPDHVLQLVRLALTRPGSVPVGDGIFVPLRLGGAVQGVLGGVYERPAAAGPGLGATDRQLLTALAGHMMVSLQLDDALRRNAELAWRNADLRRARLEEYPRRIGADERRRLARDLHDGAARQILSVGLAVESCRVQAPLGSPIRTKLDYAKRLAREALDQVRSSIQSLSSGTAADDADLPTLLHGLRTFRATTDFHLTVDVTGVPIPLAGTATRSLFRIASECLFNTAAHAGARRAIVRLVYGRDALRLVVADDGHGDPQTIRKIVRGEVPGTGNGYHRGLTDIAARVDELGGVLVVERSDLGGVLIEVVLVVPRVRDPETPPGGTDG
jgi:signal transduction histidine kinase